jgi:hypothetical protein
VLVVLALVAFLFTLSSSNISFFHRITVRAQLESLQMECRHLQQRAMTLNQQQELIFDRATNSYTFGQQRIALPHFMRFGVLPGVKGPPATPTHVISHPITFKKDRIVFHPDGIISPGTVYLVDTNNQFLYALSCAVAQVSFLRLYRYRNGWEQLT